MRKKALIPIGLICLTVMIHARLSEVDESSEEVARSVGETASDIDRAVNVEVLIPALRGRTEAEKIRTLRWWLTLPGNKIISLFHDLNGDRSRPISERSEIARQRISGVLNLLVKRETSDALRL